MARLDRILVRRDAIVRDLAAWAEGGSGREALIAGGMAARLATEPGSLLLEGAKPGEWVAGRLKQLRGELIRLNGEYTLASTTRQVEIRNHILARGLPGDPLVRRMWAMRDAALQ